MLLHPLSCNHINQGGRWTAIFVGHVLQKGFFLVAVSDGHWVITGHGYFSEICEVIGKHRGASFPWLIFQEIFFLFEPRDIKEFFSIEKWLVELISQIL